MKKNKQRLSNFQYTHEADLEGMENDLGLRGRILYDHANGNALIGLIDRAGNIHEGYLMQGFDGVDDRVFQQAAIKVIGGLFKKKSIIQDESDKFVDSMKKILYGTETI